MVGVAASDFIKCSVFVYVLRNVIWNAKCDMLTRNVIFIFRLIFPVLILFSRRVPTCARCSLQSTTGKNQLRNDKTEYKCYVICQYIKGCVPHDITHHIKKRLHLIRTETATPTIFATKFYMFFVLKFLLICVL